MKAAAIGNFDGVHRGHALLLNFLSHESQERGLTPIAITFSPHPLQIIDPQKAPPLLQSEEEKLAMLQALGTTPVELPFTHTLRTLTAEQFLTLLARDYSVRLLVVGHDNRFGSDSPPNATHARLLEKYAAIGQKLDIEIISAPRIEGISSSEIRKALAAGNVATAAKMLGRHYTWSGTVEHGKELGRTIGFPTANLSAIHSRQLIPSEGVYACRATIDAKDFPAMVNIGRRPTVDTAGAPVTIEAHIDGLQQNIYGKEVMLTFIDHLRQEKQFSSIEHLQAQLQADLLATRKIYCSK